MSTHRLGSGKRRRMTKYTLGELSMVDRAQQPTPNLIFKRRDLDKAGHRDDEKRKRRGVKKDIDDGIVVITSSEARHSHGFMMFPGEQGGSTWFAMDPQDEVSHDHPWLIRPDGSIQIGENLGHTHSVNREEIIGAFLRISPIARGDTEILSMAKIMKVEFTEDGGVTDLFKAGDPGATKEGDMPDPKQTMEALEKKLARAMKLAELTDIQKSHILTLSKDGQTAFLEKDDAGRTAEVDAEITKKAAADPLMYTCDDGTKIHKSDGPLLAKMAKDRDDDRKELAKARAMNADASFSKQAGEHLDALPGTLEVRTALVKAVEGITDEGMRSLVAQSILAGNSAMKAAFDSLGSGGGGSVLKDAEAELERLATAHMVEKGVDYYTAYAVVSEANPVLTKRAITGEE